MSPRNSSDHEVFEQLAAGYALSALEPGDEQVFLAHVPGCARCADALVEHREALGHLAYAAGAEAPPPAVLEGIRAQLRAESGADGDLLVAPSSLTEARERRRRRVPLGAALTGLAASLVLAASLLVSNLGPGEQRQQDRDLTAVNKVVAELLVPGARQIEMKGSARGVAVVNGSKVSLVMTGLAANDRRSSVYVVWGKTRFGSVSAVGTFDVRSQDLTVVNGLRLSNPATLEALMITKEAGRRAPPITSQTPLVVGTA